MNWITPDLYFSLCCVIQHPALLHISVLHFDTSIPAFGLRNYQIKYRKGLWNGIEQTYIFIAFLPWFSPQQYITFFYQYQSTFNILLGHSPGRWNMWMYAHSWFKNEPKSHLQGTNSSRCVRRSNTGLTGHGQESRQQIPLQLLGSLRDLLLWVAGSWKDVEENQRYNCSIVLVLPGPP